MLKEGAKPVADNRKRRKISVLSLPRQPPAEMQQQKAADADENMSDGVYKDVTHLIKMPTRSKKGGDK